MTRIAPLCFLLLAACAAPADAPDPDEDLRQIEAQARALSEAYMAGDIDALVAIYTEDGVAIPGNRDFVQGHEALARLWSLPEGRDILHHETRATKLVVDGDHAYDYGYFEGRAAQDGEPLNPFGGAYVIVWERGDDGVWRIDADMWNSLPQE